MILYILIFKSFQDLLVSFPLDNFDLITSLPFMDFSSIIKLFFLHGMFYNLLSLF